MTAKPVPEHIDMRVATDEQLRTFVDAIAAAFPGELTEPRKVLAEVSRRLTELQHRREAAGFLAQDVIDLVIAARMVAYEDQSPEAIRALDKALEAFAERVGWDNDPDDEARSALGEHP
jgi:cell division septum initiation protein DivIVA